MIQLFDSRKWFIAGAFSGLILVFVLIGAGCSSTTQTTKTQTTVTSPDGNSGNSNGEDGAVSKSETTTTTTEAPHDSPGVLSSTLHAVGYVLALPFIIVGGLLKMIF